MKNWRWKNLTSAESAAVLAAAGGLPDNIVNTAEFIDYAKSGGACGYIGSSGRTSKRDIIVAKVLAGTGMGSNGIACWLSSGDGRYMMDDPPKGHGEAFIKYVKGYTSNAAKSVAI